MVEHQGSVGVLHINLGGQIELRDGQLNIDLLFLVYLRTRELPLEFRSELKKGIGRIDRPEIHGKIFAGHIGAVHTAIAVELHSRHAAVYRDVRRAEAETVAPIDTVYRTRNDGG